MVGTDLAHDTMPLKQIIDAVRMNFAIVRTIAIKCASPGICIYQGLISVMIAAEPLHRNPAAQ